MIEEATVSFTKVEETIAGYFLSDQIDSDFSSKYVAQKLFISEASLSRFAKKVGFSGYREFIFAYNQNIKENKRLDQLTEFAIHKYQMLLEKTYQIVDNQQMIRISKLLDEKKRVFIYGIGSSGLAAKEFCYRFMRLGLDVYCFVDGNEIRINTSRVNEDTLVLGISVSGKTEELISGLEIAKHKKATTILMTSKLFYGQELFSDEIVKMPYIKNVVASNVISPQLPALVMIDVLYVHYLNYNKELKVQLLQETLDSIDFEYEK